MHSAEIHILGGSILLVHYKTCFPVTGMSPFDWSSDATCHYMLFIKLGGIAFYMWQNVFLKLSFFQALSRKKSLCFIYKCSCVIKANH